MVFFDSPDLLRRGLGTASFIFAAIFSLFEVDDLALLHRDGARQYVYAML
jgi:hypothetical protein